MVVAEVGLDTGGRRRFSRGTAPAAGGRPGTDRRYGVAVIEDEVMERIGRALSLAYTDSRPAATEQLERIWAELEFDGTPLHRCVVAHHRADLCDDAGDELTWDLRALAAADELAGQGGAGGVVRVEQLYPSLHLNLADVYRRRGDPDRARHHLVRAEASVASLEGDGYGRMVRRGIERLADRLAAGDLG